MSKRTAQAIDRTAHAAGSEGRHGGGDRQGRARAEERRGAQRDGANPRLTGAPGREGDRAMDDRRTTSQGEPRGKGRRT